jgi:opacity protein-like surface antigen
MRHLMIITIMLLASFTAISTAQDWYIGAGIGNAFIGTEVEDAQNQLKTLDENSTGYKFFAGLTTPTFLGVEGGYRNLGTVTVSDLSFESKTTGWDVYGMGRFQVLAIVDLFAKAGMFFWKTEDKFVENIFSKTGSDFAWGLGAGVHLGPVGVRLEWENFQVADPVTLSMLSLSATYGF